MNGRRMADDTKHPNGLAGGLPGSRVDGLRAIPRSIWALGCVSMFMDLSSEMIHSLLPVFLVSALGASALSFCTPWQDQSPELGDVKNPNRKHVRKAACPLIFRRPAWVESERNDS